MYSITYREDLFTKSPYLKATTGQYISFLKSNLADIEMGNKGIYLARKIAVGEEYRYFPFLDIDGDSNVSDYEKIMSASAYLMITYQALYNLGISNRFYSIASGGTGYRMISPMLLTKKHYQAFVDLIKAEFPHITDVQPTEELTMPHQLFAYKGNKNQNTKILYNRHSALIQSEAIEDDFLSYDSYLQSTDGKPDPERYVQYIENFFSSFEIIDDLGSLHGFGDKLREYENVNNNIQIRPFDFFKSRHGTNSVSLEVMKSILDENGIECNIDERGNREAISFTNLSCPVCRKTTSNAVAYPPAYVLHCFYTNCPAHKGIPFYKWSNLDMQFNYEESDTASEDSGYGYFNIQYPDRFETIDETRQKITDAIKSPDDALIIATPGTGKSYIAQQVLAELGANKLILYSCYNKNLQKEAYKNMRRMAFFPNDIHLIDSKNDVCSRKSELKKVTKAGFSPGQLLCSSCNQKSSCRYYQQRQSATHGIFVVTHKMLQYLQDLFPKPDLIILDENLIDGFLHKEQCERANLYQLLTILDEQDQTFILKLFEIISLIESSISMDSSNSKYLKIINGKRLLSSDHSESTIMELLCKVHGIKENLVIDRISRIVEKLNNFMPSVLYNKDINMKIINWLEGLGSDKYFSYLQIQKGKLTFCYKHMTPLPANYQSSIVKILDATGDKKATDIITQKDVSVIKSDVRWQSKRTHIIMKTTKYAVMKMSSYEIKTLMKLALEQVEADKILILSYESKKKEILDASHDIDDSKEYRFYHFYGPRGINDFKNINAVIVIGLPRPNPNAAWHDAHFLYPGEQDSLKDIYPDACMYNELVQIVHRIRPVNKASVELVIVSEFWPSIFEEPEPDRIIDNSKDKNKIEKIENRLLPFIKKFGFFHPDIGYLANVYHKSKKNVVSKFQKRITDMMQSFYLLENLVFQVDENATDRTFSGNSIHKDICIIMIQNILRWILKRKQHFPYDFRHKKENFPSGIIEKQVSFTSYIYKRRATLNYPKKIPLAIKSIFESSRFSKWDIRKRYYSVFLPVIYTPDNGLLDDIKTFLEEKFPHFEEFQIKLPHSRNQYVKGIGEREKVIEFYRELNRYETSDVIKIGSYQTVNHGSQNLPSLPDGIITVLFPSFNPEIINIGYKAVIISLYRHEIPSKINEIQNEMENDIPIKVITNDGKTLCKIAFDAGLNQFEIEDIFIRDKIIKFNKKSDLKELFKRYKLPVDATVSMEVVLIYHVYQRQNHLIERFGLQRIVDLEKQILWIVSKMEMTGIKVNYFSMIEYIEALESQRDDIIKQIYTLLPTDIPIKEKDIIKYIEQEYEIQIPELKKGFIEIIEKEDARFILSKYQEQKTQKAKITKIYNYLGLIKDDDRLHEEINQIGTVTGRFTASLHQMPKKTELRKCFIPENGNVFIIADYSSYEPRIAAGLSGETRMIEIFHEGNDIYREIAKMITGSDDDKTRNVMKTIVLGLNYGMSEYGIHKRLNEEGFSYSLEEIRDFISLYFNEFSEFLIWRENLLINSRDNGFVQTRMGRIRWITNQLDDNPIINYPIQATGADGFKTALILIYYAIEEMDAKIVHTRHDEVIVECKKEIMHEVKDIIKESMEEAFVDIIQDVPFVAEPKIQSAWGVDYIEEDEMGN